jgi:hypothetical protein
MNFLLLWKVKILEKFWKIEKNVKILKNWFF